MTAPDCRRASLLSSTAAVDPRLGAMERSAARLTLLDYGMVGLAEAFQPLPQAFTEAAGVPACPTCGASPCVNPGFCRKSRSADRNHSRADERTARLRHLMGDDVSMDAAWNEFNKRREKPQTLIEAIMYSVRTRGLAAMQEPATQERLSRCDAAARSEIERRVAKLKAEGRLP
jgi:hypothetical protein